MHNIDGKIGGLITKSNFFPDRRRVIILEKEIVQKNITNRTYTYKEKD